MLVPCHRKLGGVQAEGGELVFLQVPGFKELQAFLHGQAFLQTLGETREGQRHTLKEEVATEANRRMGQVLRQRKCG